MLVILRDGFAVGALLGTVLPAAVLAQAGRRLEFVRDLEIQGSQVKVRSGDIHVVVSASGRLAVAPLRGSLITVVARDAKQVWGVGGFGEKPGEFLEARWMGWIGQTDSLWVADPLAKRISIFGPDMKFARAFPLPDAPKGGGIAWVARNVPMVEGVGPGGTLLLRPFPNIPPMQAMSLGDLIAVTSEDGTVRTLRRFAMGRTLSLCGESLKLPQGGLGIQPLFCPKTFFALDPLTFASVEVSPPREQRVSVTRTTGQGDTTFVRTLSISSRPVTAAEGDSAARAMAADPAPGNSKALNQAMDSVRRAHVPAFHPPVTAVVAGVDGTTWIGTDSRDLGRAWVALGADGSDIGSAMLPSGVQVFAAARAFLWGLEHKAGDEVLLVRFLIRP